MDIQEVIKLYLSSIENNTTRRCYKAALSQFAENIDLVEQITIDKIQNYKRSLEDKSAQTICARLAAVRGLADLCWTKGWLNLDPSLFINNVANPRYTKAKVIESHQFRRIINRIHLDCDGIHDYLLLKLIFILGRCEKVRKLKWNDALPRFADTLSEVYRASAISDPALKISEEGYLFFPFAFNNKIHLTQDEVREILQIRAIQAGYARNQFDIMSIKRLRAKEIYDLTDSVEEVQKLCGFKYRKDAVRFINTL